MSIALEPRPPKRRLTAGAAPRGRAPRRRYPRSRVISRCPAGSSSPPLGPTHTLAGMATFEERIDPELVAGLDIYRFLGFESQQLSGDTLTHIRGKLVEMRSVAETMMPANDRVARSDRTVSGPAGAPDVRVRTYRP